jgi:hypothetical protein
MAARKTEKKAKQGSKQYNAGRKIRKPALHSSNQNRTASKTGQN